MSEEIKNDKTYLYYVLFLGLFAYAPYEMFWWFNTPKPYLIFSSIVFILGLFSFIFYSRKTGPYLLGPFGLILFYFGISLLQKFISWKTNAGFEITDISMLMVFIFPFIGANKIEKIKNTGIGNNAFFGFVSSEFYYLLSIIGIWIIYAIYLFLMTSF
jgi:hypothetical protein